MLMERFNYYTCDNEIHIVMDERYNVVLGQTKDEKSAIKAVNALNTMSDKNYLEQDIAELNLFY